MVIEISSGKEKYYQCAECRLSYKEKEWAEKCEDWCKKNNSCNLEITKYSIERVDKRKSKELEKRI